MAGDAGRIEVKLIVDHQQAVDRLKAFEKQIVETSNATQTHANAMSASFKKVKGPRLTKATAGTKKLGTQMDKTRIASDKLAASSKKTALSFAKFAGAAFVVQRIGTAFFRAADAGAQYNLRIAEIATLTDELNFSTAQQREIVESVASAYGEKFIQTAPALYDAISAGATNAAEATEVLDSAVKLSIGTISTQAQSVSLLVGVLNAYGDEVGGAAAVTDDFFAIVRQGKLRLEELDPALGRVTPLAKAAGVSFKELGASIIALTRSGSSASEAITKIRSILNATIKKQREFDEAFQKIGLRFDSSTIKSRGFLNTLQLLREATGNSNEELGKLIGRVEGTTGTLSLVDDEARLFTEALDGMANSAGSANQAFNELRGSDGRQFEEIKNSLSNFFVEVGEDMARFVVQSADVLRFFGILDKASIAPAGLAGMGDELDRIANSLSESTGIEAISNDVIRLGALLRDVGISDSISTDLEVAKIGVDGLVVSVEKFERVGQGANREFGLLSQTIFGVPEQIAGLIDKFNALVSSEGIDVSLPTDVLESSLGGEFVKRASESAKQASVEAAEAFASGFNETARKSLDEPTNLFGGSRKNFLAEELGRGVEEAGRAGIKNADAIFRKLIRDGVLPPMIEEMDDGGLLVIEGLAASLDESGKTVLSPVIRRIAKENAALYKASFKIDPTDFVFSEDGGASPVPDLGLADSLELPSRESLSLSAAFGVDAFLVNIEKTGAPLAAIVTSFKDINGAAEAIVNSTEEQSKKSSKALIKSDELLENDLKRVITEKVLNDERTRALALQVALSGEGKEDLLRSQASSERLDAVARAMTKVLSIRRDIGFITGDEVGEQEKSASIGEVIRQLSESELAIKGELALAQANLRRDDELAISKISLATEKAQANALQGLEKERALRAVTKREALLSIEQQIAKSPQLTFQLLAQLQAMLAMVDAQGLLAEASAEGKIASAHERNLKLEGELKLGINARVEAIEIARAAEVRALNDVIPLNEEHKAALARTVELINERAARSADAAILRSEQDIAKALEDVLRVETMIADLKGRTSAGSIQERQFEIAELERLIAAKTLEFGAESRIVEVLEAKLVKMRELQALANQQDRIDAGEGGFFASFADELGNVTEDVNSIGDLGKSVAGTFNDLTRSWITQLKEGGNAWESFEDLVLQGLLDIAAQWAVMGVIGAAVDGIGGLFTEPQAPQAPGTASPEAEANVKAAAQYSESAGLMAQAAADMDAAGLTNLSAGALNIIAATLWTPVASQLVLAGGLLLAAAALGGGGTPALARGGVIGGRMKGSTGLPTNAYATGGIASTPQLAIFGEGDGAEAFVPLPDGKTIPVTADFSGILETAKMLQSAVNRLDRAHSFTVGSGGSATSNMLADNRQTNLNFTIDARGSSDPGAIDLAVKRGIAESMPQIENSIGNSMATGRSSVLVNGVRQASGRG